MMLQLTQNVSMMQQSQAASTSTNCSHTAAKDLIPSFDPEDRSQTMEKWLEFIDELARAYGWDDQHTTINATAKLRGLAKTWYRALPSLNHDWPTWKRMLKTAFPSSLDYYQQLKIMTQRVKLPSESYMKYYFEQLALLTSLDITGEKAVSCIIGGITDTVVQTAARAGNYTTPEALFVYLRTIRDEKRGSKQIYQKNKISRSYNSSTVREEPQQRGPLRCFRCGRRGHTRKVCQEPLPDQRNQRNQRETTRDRGAEREGNYIYINVLNKSSDKYFMNVKLNGERLKAFIDFGATCNTIKHAEAKRLGLPINSDDKKTIRGFANGHTNTLGTIKQQLLSVQGVQAKVDIHVVPNDVQDTPMIIGQPFTELPSVLILKDSNNLRIYDKTIFPSLDYDIQSSDRILLWSTTSLVIPPGYTGYVPCQTPYPGEFFVDKSVRHKPGQEHCIPRSIYRVSDDHTLIVPVVNISHNDLCIRKNKILARGWRCSPNLESATDLQVNAITIGKDDVNLGETLTINQQDTVLTLLREFSDCFSSSIKELGCTKAAEMHINLVDQRPITHRPYRMALKEREKVHNMVSELLEAGIIRESDSAYASPIILVKKKNGDERLCIDYRKLNRQTIPDRHPLPRIDDQLDHLQGARYFTSLDMMSGYYQIPVAESSKHKTSFVTPDGQYEFNRMPFGLTNAPSVFQRMVNKVLGPLNGTVASAYLDDIISPAPDFEEGLRRLTLILNTLRAHGLTLNLKKCHFFQPSITYLGFEINQDGVKPGKDKVYAIQNFPVPQDVHQVRQFLGLTGFFRHFVKHYAIILRPLTLLTKKNHAWNWGKDQQTAFETMKDVLSNEPLLVLYNPTAETEVHTDASKLGLGGILLQRQSNGHLQPVSYYSRQTTPQESVYHSYELETLAVVETLKKFRVYLLGIQFRVITDCNALKTASTKRDLLPRIARWWLQLQELSFTVEYRAGTRMAHADALSRNPLEPNQGDDFKIVLNIQVADWVASSQLSDEKIKMIFDILKRSQKQNTKIKYTRNTNCEMRKYTELHQQDNNG